MYIFFTRSYERKKHQKNCCGWVWLTELFLDIFKLEKLLYKTKPETILLIQEIYLKRDKFEYQNNWAFDKQIKQ